MPPKKGRAESAAGAVVCGKRKSSDGPDSDVNINEWKTVQDILQTKTVQQFTAIPGWCYGEKSVMDQRVERYEAAGVDIAKSQSEIQIHAATKFQKMGLIETLKQSKASAIEQQAGFDQATQTALKAYEDQKEIVRQSAAVDPNSKEHSQAVTHKDNLETVHENKQKKGFDNRALVGQLQQKIDKTEEEVRTVERKIRELNSRINALQNEQEDLVNSAKKSFLEEKIPAVEKKITELKQTRDSKLEDAQKALVKAQKAANDEFERAQTVELRGLQAWLKWVGEFKPGQKLNVREVETGRVPKTYFLEERDDGK